MTEGRKTEPPLYIDLDFDEALERFAGADPKEVAESIDRSKQKRPPGNEPPRRPARKPREKPPKNRITRSSGD